MKTVSDVRVEKRVKELQAERKAARKQAYTKAIKEQKIKAEKERIIECLSQNFFGMAANSMNRLITLTEK
tara:strand:- start:272 stop:481 length:210 start_codon:yes stop_codon:yes gene_type:complete